jgi:hypothetical protein
MTLLLLEALGAMLLLVLIVWWTMFSGRKGGEPVADDTQEPAVTPVTSTSSIETPIPITTKDTSNCGTGLPASSVSTKADQAQT